MTLTMKPMKDMLSKIPLLKKRVVRKQLQIASQITDFLSARNWKQRDLSRHTGLKESYISKVLAGEANMTVETICKFEDAFDEDIIVVKKFLDSHRDVRVFTAHTHRIAVPIEYESGVAVSGFSRTAHDGYSAKVLPAPNQSIAFLRKHHGENETAYTRS